MSKTKKAERERKRERKREREREKKRKTQKIISEIDIISKKPFCSLSLNSCCLFTLTFSFTSFPEIQQ